MEEEENRAEKKPLVLDWEKLLPTGVRDEDQPLPVVVPSTTTVEPPKPSPMSFDRRGGFYDHFEPKALSDHELELTIKRQQSIMGMASKMKDKGEKLKAHIKRLLEEKERRKFSRPDKGVEGGTKPTQLDNSIRSGAPDGFGQDRGSPHDHPQSSFGKEFSKRLETNSNFMRVNASDKGFSNLGSYGHCGKRPNGRVSPNARKKRRSLARQRPNQNSSSSYLNGNKHVFSNSNPNSKDSSTYSLRRHKDNMSNRFAKMQNADQDLPTKEMRTSKDQTFILVDEEEEDYQTVEAEECGEELPESMKDAKIYYPSRDDPDPVVICYADLYCLAPETYLTSTIMNFYIRYLQQQVAPTNTMIHDYLFFNTYFYEKLKEAVTCKGTDKNSKFLKFRRWWKGVNVFQKAYVLIPIHQDLHWSLVIICIPDKEDESGPIVLHLDSLGLHDSRSVFNNIKSYMKEEWNCLNQEIDLTDLPIVEDIWEDLPSRIEEKKVMVPRQKNDYDCGLFVLFFMELFILDAPQRLVKEKDLPLMFGRDWFQPKDASGLRKKIRNLLKEEFQNAAEVATLSQTPSS